MPDHKESLAWDGNREIISSGNDRIQKPMKEARIASMPFEKLHECYVNKAVRKGRKAEEVDRIVCWLTGYRPQTLQAHLCRGSDVETFLLEAPAMNPARFLIKGIVCGVRVEAVQDPFMQTIRYLDKLVDELAKGKTMKSILRKP